MAPVANCEVHFKTTSVFIQAGTLYLWTMDIPTLADMQVLLQRKRQLATDEITLEFLKKGMLFFVDGKEKCWWCSADKRVISTELLVIFSFEESPKVKEFKVALADQLTRCTSCISAYYEAKSNLRQQYSKLYESGRVNAFFGGIEAWDVSRILRSFSHISSIDTASGRIVLYEALRSSEYLLYFPDIVTAVDGYIKKCLSSGDILNMGNRMLPGFITLCFGADSQIREWARRSVRMASSKHSNINVGTVVNILAGLLQMLAKRADPRRPYAVSSTEPTAGSASSVNRRLDKITFVFSNASVWHGLRVVLGRLTVPTKQALLDRLDGFPVIVLKFLLDMDEADFVEALRTFAEILGAAGERRIWPRILVATSNRPDDIASLIIDHPAVRREFCRSESKVGDGATVDLGDSALSTHNKRLRHVLDWITPFIGSLLLPKDADAVVILLKGLLVEIPAASNVPLISSALAVHTGLAIVTHCLKLPNSEKYMEDGSFVLTGFLNENVRGIVNIAQGADPFSASELLISGAETLINAMVREDLECIFNGVTQISNAAQNCYEEFKETHQESEQASEDPPILITFPSLWSAILCDPQNTNVVKKAMFACSYLLLFDPVPKDMARFLPEMWHEAYNRFECEREDISTMLNQLLDVVSCSLSDTEDVGSRKEFEHDVLDSMLRLLVSPHARSHGIVMSILRPASLESDQGGGDSIVSTDGQYSHMVLTDSSLDMACYDLYNRYGDLFLERINVVVQDCNILVTQSRPASTCSSNIARLARSSISAIQSLSGTTKSTEAMVKVFFSFCSLLGAILKASTENNIQAGGRGIYIYTVPVVFQTVSSILGTVEFSGFMSLVKGSTELDENEAMDALSMCVWQMLKYLEGDDELGVASGIIKVFGLISSGLTSTPGTSMLYPVETVQALTNGTQGQLTHKLCERLRTITSMPVWEPRSISISRNKPVQIVFDDEDVLASMNDFDLSDVLGGVGVQDKTADIYGTSMLKPLNLSSENIIPDKKASAPPPKKLDPVVVVDSPPPKEYKVWPSKPKQTSMDYWTSRSTPADGGKLNQTKPSRSSMWAEVKRDTSTPSSSTLYLPKKSTVTTTTVKGNKTSNSGAGGLMGKLRSNFVQERRGMTTKGSRVPAISSFKQISKAPQAMSTIPVDKWEEDRFTDPYVPTNDSADIYVRDVSKEALDALAREQVKSASGDDDSDDDDSDLENQLGGLAGLIKIPKKSDSKAPIPPRRTMKLLSPSSGRVVDSFHHKPMPKSGMFYDPQAKERNREAERAKKRLAPSMASLHVRLLDWEYEDSSDIPPDMQDHQLNKVPNRFSSPDQYILTFEPLLLLESWAQFQRAKEETVYTETSKATLKTRMSVDEFQELTFVVSQADAQDIQENDIVVFSECMAREKRMAQRARPGKRNTAPPTATSSPFGDSDGTVRRPTFLAMVKNRAFGKDRVQVVFRVHMQGSRQALFIDKLVTDSAWEFLKLFSLTPIHREYAALRSLPYLNPRLVDEILRPQITGRKRLQKPEVLNCMKTHALNQPQAEAVVAAMKRENGFTLIQGPPGTGKTKTILGLTGALLALAKERKQSAGSHHRGSPGVEVIGDNYNPSNQNNKLLICAPSNAAVDEIVKRLKSGVRDHRGKTFYPRVVRVGQAESISSTVRDTTLDFLLDKALSSYSTDGENVWLSGSKDIGDVQSELLLEIAGMSRKDGRIVNHASQAKEVQKNANESVRSLRQQLDEANMEHGEIEKELQNVDPRDVAAIQKLRGGVRKSMEKKRSICQRLDAERARVREATKTMDATRHRIRLQILQRTDVLCCTLSGSGHDLLTSLNCTFDTVIIDEAAQSVELSCLIPLKYGCERCILVGDPNQLPPTVLSQKATQYIYNQSMFVRIQNNSPGLVSLLSIQYRMHPEISVFPSRLFYDSRLKDGPGMAEKQSAPWHLNARYPPFQFLNIWSGKELTGKSHSVYNMAEIEAAIQLVYHLCRDFSRISWKQKIGIITPYKQQLRMLKDRFKEFFGSPTTDAIEFNTVDGFQGQEKEVIIFSCVRAGGSGVGFLEDNRRMNVGLTRARKSLFVLGNANLLRISKPWRSMIDDARSRGLLKDTPLPLYGQPAPPKALQCDNLFQEGAVDKKDVADGEGDRAEFMLESINDEELEKFNQYSNHKLQADIAGKDQPKDAKGGTATERLPREGEDRKRNTSTYASVADSNGQPKRAKVEAPLEQKPAPPTLRVDVPTRITYAATVQPPQDKDAKVAAERQKQKNSLFIPKKRGGGNRPALAAPNPAPIAKQPPLPRAMSPTTPNELPMANYSSVMQNVETANGGHRQNTPASATSSAAKKPHKRRKGGLFRPSATSSVSGESSGRKGSGNQGTDLEDMISSMLKR